MKLITDTDELTAYCARLAQAPYITVDTEFLREKTFWPRLCLVQVAGPEDELIIDPLASGMDLSPLYDLMANTAVLKVFHAARQDVEIFHHDGGVIPRPMFDTQVAAMVCGFGDSVGYDTLARKISKVHIDKSSRFSDWSVRPLSERQLKYAMQDVTHLRGVYEWLARELRKNGREAWLMEEMAILTDPKTYLTEPREAWLRIKTRGGNRRFLGVLREITAWRETEAQTRDLPRNRVIRDEALLEIAAHPPHTIAEMGKMRSVTAGFAEGKLGQSLLAAIRLGAEMPEADLPPLPDRDPPGKSTGGTVELLKVLLKIKCEQAGVASKLVANSADLDRIAADDEADVPAMHGWRRELFGLAALQLKHGKLAITMKGNKIVLAPLAGEP
ncbi:MAG: ribonuclease D [Alphaproteobacteria bacterium]